MASRRVARPLLLQLRSLWRRAPARQPLEAQLRYHIAAAAGGKGKPKEDDSPYKDTVRLPTTKFGMRANSRQREPVLQEQWSRMGLYETLSRENPGEAFTIHDGPPYANGDLHMGHALNKVLKDVINKYQLLRGRRAKYVPGWDCHGLPIELKVLQGLSPEQRESLSPIQLRRRAKDFALKTVKSQMAGFKRFGVWADWDAPYLTLQPEYEAAQLRVFGKMVARGHIYRGKKPVHWSPSSGTALAESELEYPDGHTSRSIYVAMPLESLGPAVPADLAETLKGASLAIWTTTPWTIPANAAVAVNPNMEYCVVEDQGRKLVVAAGLVESLSLKVGASLSVLGQFSGSVLEGCDYRHPLSGLGGPLDRRSPVVLGGDYITTDSGTGLVHTAPGHGVEDYQVGLKYGLPMLSPVDDRGILTTEAGPRFEGLSVLGEGNTAVVEELEAAGALLKEELYAHRYPYDWRTKQPVIFRATEQWFASVEGFKADALEAIQSVQWIPASGIHRITAMTQGRSDWCISRQRKWGVPLPVFYRKDTGEALMTQQTIEHIAKVVEEKGTDVWWQAPIEVLLPPELQSEAENLTRGMDTMDVWFDSGCSWASVLQRDATLGLPADLYLEGSDQHRGWFQSSLLTCIAATGAPPYKSVLTHGFVLDERPAYGADVLRLWVASVDFTSDVLIGGNILAQVSDVYRKIRFTVRFLLGNLQDFDPTSDAVAYEALPITDRYMLLRLSELLKDVTASYDSFQLFRVYQAVQRFTVTELSNFYLDVVKDRLYVTAAGSHERRSCQTVLAAMLQGLLAAVAPILPHLAEDAWSHLPWPAHRASVFQAGWRQPDDEWATFPAAEAATAAMLRAIRDHVNQVLEEARRGKLLGASLEAWVRLFVEDAGLRAELEAWDRQPNAADPLRYLFIVSQAELVDSAAEAEASDFSASLDLEVGGKVTAGVSKAAGRKCQRCWNYSVHTGDSSEHPDLCERCVPVIRELGFRPTREAAALVG